jgi:cysteine desulfurase
MGAGGAEREHHLIERLWSAIREIPGIQRHGHPDRRAPHILCVSVEGIEAEPLLIGLDQHGVSTHSGSSCSSEILEPSPVLAAMGAAADRSLRFSVGHGSSETEIDLAARALAVTVQRLHALRRA